VTGLSPTQEVSPNGVRKDLIDPESRPTSRWRVNHPQAKSANAGWIYGLSLLLLYTKPAPRCAPGSPRLRLKRAMFVPASSCLRLREIPALGRRGLWAQLAIKSRHAQNGYDAPYALVILGSFAGVTAAKIEV